MPKSDWTGILDSVRAKTGKTDLMTSGVVASEIDGIKAGGSESVSPKEVNFYDYDGTILHSYTVEEAQALTELPELPERDGLICQGWNYDLETIKSYNRAVNVGAMYITDDGKTRLYISIAAEGRMDVPLYFSQTVANGVTIDWGDGSATETINGTGKVNTSHTYASIGDYVITLDVAKDCDVRLGEGTSYSYCVMGSTSNAGKVYCNMLKKVELGSGMGSFNGYAFRDCCSLTYITIHNAITDIAQQAFSGCYSLKHVNIPNSVRSVSSYAFSNCYSLVSLSIPDITYSLSEYVFQNCNSLISISLSNRLSQLSTSLFSGCSSLKKIGFPDSITNMTSNVFKECYSLESINFPNGLTSISMACINCYSLKSVSIPDGVVKITQSAFSACRALVSIIFPSSVTEFSTSVFANCTGMAFYDFTACTTIPTLSDKYVFSNIPSDCQIRVPASLYDEWVAATNWSEFASQIVAV
jgi:hypothetical protein